MKIVAIDDDADYCEILKQKFSEDVVVTFTKFSEAIYYLTQNDIDVIMLDYIMPGQLTGLDGFIQVSSHFKNHRRIAMSAMNLARDNKSAYEALLILGYEVYGKEYFYEHPAKSISGITHG